MVKSRDRPMCGASRRRSRAQSAWNVEIHIERRPVEQRLHALAHLLRAALFVKVTASTSSGCGEAFGDEVGDAVRDDARLAGARAGKDEQRAFGVSNGVRAARDSEKERRIRTCSYSTVTLFARFLGWSTSQPRRTAMW